MPPESGVILVGHGAVPSDCPPELVAELKRLESAARGGPSPMLEELDAKIRGWPRTPKTDPYQAGLEAIAAALRKRFPKRLVLTAYNEFCRPTLEDSFLEAVRQGAREVTVVATMYTRGGVHSETEIPAILAALKREHPAVTTRYVWPFELSAVEGFLAGEIRRIEAGPARP